jgi:hypothetical protein
MTLLLNLTYPRVVTLTKNFLQKTLYTHVKFWDSHSGDNAEWHFLTPCCLVLATNISTVSTASKDYSTIKMKAACSFQVLGTRYYATRRPNLGGSNHFTSSVTKGDPRWKGNSTLLPTLNPVPLLQLASLINMQRRHFCRTSYCDPPVYEIV